MFDDADGQIFFWDDLFPSGRAASEDEKIAALQEGTTMALRHHHGPVPRVFNIDGDWFAFRATIIEFGFPRLKKFAHGGKYTLKEYAYLASYFALRDIQREMMKDEPASTFTHTTPLLDLCLANGGEMPRGDQLQRKLVLEEIG